MNLSLAELQRSQGAQYTDDGSPALDFGNPRDEYTAARDDCALFDLSDRCQIELTGADRAKFLHNFCTNNILAFTPGSGCEAFCTNVKGRVLAHIFVFVDTESLWLESVAGAEDSLLTHLDRYLITEDVQLHARTAARGELFVSGSRAAERLKQLGLNVEKLEPFEHSAFTMAERPLLARRVDLLAQPGFLLSASRDHLVDLWRHITTGGIAPAGAIAYEVLRIEAGMPHYGIDISDENLAQEVARTKQAISFQKGCYLGQEPIARLDALGHVNRELRLLRFEAGPCPARGATVVSLADQSEVGAITSAAQLCEAEPPVALAYLRSSALSPGTQVLVEVNGESIPATVDRPAEL